jgi:hypothetical protein
MIKRKMLIFTDTYSDAMYLANTLYRPALDKQTICSESAFNNGELIRVEREDCIFYIGVE